MEPEISNGGLDRDADALAQRIDLVSLEPVAQDDELVAPESRHHVLAGNRRDSLRHLD
jgi:hypothetical protein